MKDSEEILCGGHAVLEQIRSDAGRIRRILVIDEHGARQAVVEEARRLGVAVAKTDARTLDRRAEGARHQGVIAEVEPFRYADWQDVVAAAPACLVALDEVTDPRNLGAIVRSAEGAGAGGILLPLHRSAGVTPVVARAAAGATARVPIAQVTNVVQALELAKKAGYWTVGLDGDATESLYGFKFPERCVIVLGAEGRGLRPLVRRHCDFRLAIPMRGAVASLNVSVAAGLALYERLRQTLVSAG